jgi:TRAP-type C4-dicarboxylate transport system permease small subunit
MPESPRFALPMQASRQSIPPTTSKAGPGVCLIDRAFDWIARVIELTLAFAFILAVLLNFTNVVGRYVFGISLLGSDEIQVFIMVGATFLGAAVVTRRNQHLRMDVLVQFMPAWMRRVLRIAEQLLLIALASFVITQSFFYARQMLRIGRTSDMAGVPMWIPHGAVVLGFALIVIVTAWRLIGIVRRPQDEAAGDKAAL